MKFILIFGLLLTLLTCGTRPADNDKDHIIGTWVRLPKPSNPFRDWSETINGGFTFYGDGSCENKAGYFKFTRNNLPLGYERFLGNKTVYKLTVDSLGIFNLNDRTWLTYKIIKLTSDSLIVMDSRDGVVRFVRKFYPVDDDDFYDQIIVSGEGCYGWCAINDISISKKGKVVFMGSNYSGCKGIYTGNISEEKYKEIVKIKLVEAVDKAIPGR